jgi:hypothetical protein
LFLKDRDATVSYEPENHNLFKQTPFRKKHECDEYQVQFLQDFDYECAGYGQVYLPGLRQGGNHPLRALPQVRDPLFLP